MDEHTETETFYYVFKFEQQLSDSLNSSNTTISLPQTSIWDKFLYKIVTNYGFLPSQSLFPKIKEDFLLFQFSFTLVRESPCATWDLHESLMEKLSNWLVVYIRQTSKSKDVFKRKYLRNGYKESSLYYNIVDWYM